MKLWIRKIGCSMSWTRYKFSHFLVKPQIGILPQKKSQPIVFYKTHFFHLKIPEDCTTLHVWKLGLKTSKKCIKVEGKKSKQILYFHISLVEGKKAFQVESFYYVNYGPSIIMNIESWSNNFSNENISTGVSVVFKTKHEWKYQNELFLKHHFSGNNVFNAIIDYP